MYTLRPATAADAAFLYTLHVAAMRDVVAATWGWDDAWQQGHFAAGFTPETIQIIQVSGEVAVLCARAVERSLQLTRDRLTARYARSS